jgi:hypothetical protein
MTARAIGCVACSSTVIERPGYNRHCTQTILSAR